MRTLLEKILRRFPGFRNAVRWVRWQAKKVPIIREISMLVDTWYFRMTGAERPDEHQSGDGDEYFEAYATILEKQVSGRVLDLGCGHGFLTKRLAARADVREVVGLDKINQFKFPSEKITFQAQDLSKNISLPRGFDVIVSSEFIEHITENEYRRLLREIVESLEENGRYLGSTPRNPTPYKVFSGSRFHVREYNEKDLRELLQEYFTDVTVRPISEYCLVWEASGKKDIAKERKKRLHLGSGEKYLPRYWNIDFPPTEHSVITVQADEYADVAHLQYPENTIEEIRNHHMFEHFPRAQALKLIVTWRRWLKADGILTIETPDFGHCAAAYSRALSRKRRFELGRHMMGSQEARWAIHYDFWDKPKFKYVLKKFGFKNIKIRRYDNAISQKYSRFAVDRILLNILGNLLPNYFYKKYGGHKLPNIVVTAKKDGAKNIDNRAVAGEILAQYLVGREGEEMRAVWMKDFES